MMKERPIIFSGINVRAILAGQKTQTRRVIKPRYALACPYQLGQRLWVRETWFPDAPDDGSWAYVQFYGCKGASLGDIPEQYRTPRYCLYKSTWSGSDLVWRSPLFMPRWASRITLEVTNLRVEKLQEISEEDAQAEGVEHDDLVGYYCDEMEGEFGAHRCNWRAGYRMLWDSINGKKHPWESNPYVWAITFRKVGVAA